jgi:hypothetical protein
MVRRGVERGELPQGVDADLIVDLVSAPVQQAMLFDESLRCRDIDRILDVVLTGAVAHASRSRKAPARPARKAVRKKKRTGAAG